LLFYTILLDENDPPVNKREENAINIVNQGFDDVAQQVNNMNINNITRYNLINNCFANYFAKILC